ncbi:hypothetical protein K525DRAFT_283491 [Schizophyllum commune Loenen D]|nr:hypothetical protein K525DRAFT_283491 [Schizophyllum commune Loenen D]
MTLPPSRSVVAITRPAPIVHDRVLVRPSMCGLSRAARPRLGAARLRRCSLSPPKAARTDYHHELARLPEGCTRALRSLRARAFGPVALSSRRVVMIPLLSRCLPSRLRCTSLLDIFHSLDHDDVI